MDEPVGFGLYDIRNARREPLPVEELVRIQEQADPKDKSPWEFGWSNQQQLVQPILAQIMGNANAPLYDWQMIDVGESGSSIQLAPQDGTQGILTGVASAYETSGNLYVPIGTYVNLDPSTFQTGEGWTFSFITWTLLAVAITDISESECGAPGSGLVEVRGLTQFGEIAPESGFPPLAVYSLWPQAIPAESPVTLTYEPFSKNYMVASFGLPCGSSSSSSSSSNNGICVDVVSDVACDEDDGLEVTTQTLCGFVTIGGVQYPVTLTLDGKSGTGGGGMGPGGGEGP